MKRVARIPMHMARDTSPHVDMCCTAAVAGFAQARRPDRLCMLLGLLIQLQLTAFDHAMHCSGRSSCQATARQCPCMTTADLEAHHLARESYLAPNCYWGGGRVATANPCVLVQRA